MSLIEVMRSCAFQRTPDWLRHSPRFTSHNAATGADERDGARQVRTGELWRDACL